MDPDVERLEAWRAGDQKAARILLNKYYDLIRRAVRTKVPEDAVDDVVQKVVMALVERREQVRAGIKLQSYVLAITRNVICDFYRTRNRPGSSIAQELDSSVHELGGGPSSIILSHENDRILLEGLRSIPLDDQFLLELYYWERLSGVDLREVFEVPEPTIRSRLRRAKKRLRTKLEELNDDRRPLPETQTDLDAWAQRLRDEIRGHQKHQRR